MLLVKIQLVRRASSLSVTELLLEDDDELPLSPVLSPSSEQASSATASKTKIRIRCVRGLRHAQHYTNELQKFDLEEEYQYCLLLFPGKLQLFQYLLHDLFQARPLGGIFVERRASPPPFNVHLTLTDRH